MKKNVFLWMAVALLLTIGFVLASCGKDSDDSGNDDPGNQEVLPGGEIVGENYFLGKWELLRLEYESPIDTTYYEPGQYVVEYQTNGDFLVSTQNAGTGVGRYSLDSKYLTIYSPPTYVKEIFTYKFSKGGMEVAVSHYGGNVAYAVPPPVQVFRKIK